MLICKFCSKECKNDNSHRNHERLCPQNKDRKYVSHTAGKPSWNKGLDKSDPRVLKNSIQASKALKGKPGRVWTEEQKAAKSEWRKQLHKDNPEAHPNRRLANNRNTMSYPEKVAYDWLTANGIDFEHQKKIDKYYPDFVIGDVILEIDGARWHNPEKDAVRDKILAQKGFTIHRICASNNIEQSLYGIFYGQGRT